MFDAGATVVPSWTASIRGTFMAILVYTSLGVACEQRWGRRGLLFSWLLAASIQPLWMLTRLRSASGVMSNDFGRRLVWMVFASTLVAHFVTFGASALAIRRVGASAPQPRAIWVRVCAGIVAGGVGAIVALVLVIVASIVGYGAAN